MFLAPIVLFTYNRPGHARQTIEALQKNDLAGQSDLIIFSDGPKTEESRLAVEEVRKYLKTVTGFKRVQIHERKENQGLANNIIDGVTRIVNEYGRIIVLEDDLVTSPYFLRYMNDALNLYENEDKVISVHGYVYPVKEVLPETFFIKGSDCLGWGTWKRGWDLFEGNGALLLKELKDRHLTKEFDFNNLYPYTDMLIGQSEGKVGSWAIRWYASAFLKDKLTLYPGCSLVFHNGSDGTGTNCGVSHWLDVKISQKPIQTGGLEITESIEGRKAFEKFLRTRTGSFVTRFKQKIKRMVNPKFQYGWFGDYPTWGQAARECGGYDAADILEKCKSALLKVKRGEAVYERDSVLFDHIQYSWPLLAGLLRCALENEGRLHVLDFGGSLGSSYYQNKDFLSGVREFSWSIVEQKHFVSCGKENFEDGVLKFYETVEACLMERKPNVCILSGVLQYLENPYEWLRRFVDLGIEYIMVDRTPFIDRTKDVITVQKVPPTIYRASYPCWVFNEARFVQTWAGRYQIVCDFVSLDRSNYQGMYFKGFILKRKDLSKGEIPRA